MCHVKLFFEIVAVFATFSDIDSCYTQKIEVCFTVFYSKTAVLLTCDLIERAKQKLAAISALCRR